MDTPPEEKKDSAAGDSKPVPTPVEVAPVVRQHQMKLGRRTLKYTTVAGRMPLRNDETDEIEAQIYFTAYTLGHNEADHKRPLTIVFNGGPGSASVWLHLGALGPRRVKMQDEGWMPAPPYQLVDNEHTWLEQTDLVFIDPVGTGYSRATKSDLNKKYWNIKGDLESVGEFIRLYLSRYSRWSSPLFLAGESYGTTRAAGLAGLLIDKGIAFNGIILISTILNFQTDSFDRGNDLPYALFLPTYTASAWYHKTLPDALQRQPLRTVLGEAELFAEGEYTTALMKGDRLSGDEKQVVIDRLAHLTGLTPTYIDQSNLRIHIMRFCKELLRDQRRTIGRLDSRFTGLDALAVSEFFEFDPALSAITPPYTAMMTDYARNELGFESDLAYETLSTKVNEGWEWDRGKYADTSEALRSALAKNPFMKVFVAMGYYDLATPHFAAQYSLSHMDIDPSLRVNIHTADYEAGHMLYLDLTSLAKLQKDVNAFIKMALG